MKFLSGICRGRIGCGCLYERKHCIREFLPNGKVVRRNRKPTEPEHVTTGFGHVSGLLPTDFVDAQSIPPFDPPASDARTPDGLGIGRGLRDPALATRTAPLARNSNASR